MNNKPSLKIPLRESKWKEVHDLVSTLGSGRWMTHRAIDEKQARSLANSIKQKLFRRRLGEMVNVKVTVRGRDVYIERVREKEGT